MIMSGATHDYKFGPKNQYRRWAWNRIDELLFRSARDAVVLYLAGVQDLDRPVARRHGFRDHNLIAVERDRIAAKTLRKDGVLVVPGDIFATLAHWPKDKPIHVLHADLCCGYSRKLAETILAAHFCGVEVFSFNLLRGRDRDFTALAKGVPDNSGHRGWNMFNAVMNYFLKHRSGESLSSICKAQCHSYKSVIPGKRRSITLCFDSVVYRNPILGNREDVRARVPTQASFRDCDCCHTYTAGANARMTLDQRAKAIVADLVLLLRKGMDESRIQTAEICVCRHLEAQAGISGKGRSRRRMMVAWLKEQNAHLGSDFHDLAKRALSAGLYSPMTYIGDIERCLLQYVKKHLSK
jgi:hypothetical protein